MRHRFWFFFWGGGVGNVDLNVPKLTDVLCSQPHRIFPFHIPSVNAFFDMLYRLVIDEHMIRFRIFFYGRNAFYRMKDGGTDRTVIGSDCHFHHVLINDGDFFFYVLRKVLEICGRGFRRFLFLPQCGSFFGNMDADVAKLTDVLCRQPHPIIAFPVPCV